MYQQVGYIPLPQKYRPKTFGELVGQPAISTTLTQALRQGRISPAYLFAGPRGTGKTSSARILAKSLNCLTKGLTDEPCGECEVCQAIILGDALDVLEVDAASNTGVDNIRDLIERADLAAFQSRYKVYIIDECHMLSTSAFNALLKTLEEPPPRVVFILATTDPQRVPATIISRCQRFDFRRIPLPAMVEHLQKIASLEGIDITPSALTRVAQVSLGGLRDAESLLDQLALFPPPVGVEQVHSLLGDVSELELLELLQAINQANPVQVLESLRVLLDQGREPLGILQHLTGFYRDLMIAKAAPQRQDLVTLSAITWEQVQTLVQDQELTTLLAAQQHLQQAERQIKNTTQPRLWLEVAVLGLLPGGSSSVQAPPRPASASPAARVTPSPASASPAARVTPPPASTPPAARVTPSPASASPAARVTPSPARPTDWERVVSAIEPYSTRIMVSQQCYLVDLQEREARVGVRSEPLLKMAQSKLANLEAAFAVVFKRPLKVNLVVAAPEAVVTSEPTPAPVPPPVTTLPPESPAADELRRAATSLAEFFRGQVVDLDEAYPPGLNSGPADLLPPDLGNDDQGLED